jgi:hypothetical protein
MTDKHPKRPRNPNQLAKSIVDIDDLSKVSLRGSIWRKCRFPVQPQ